MAPRMKFKTLCLCLSVLLVTYCVVALVVDKPLHGIGGGAGRQRMAIT